MQKVAQVFLQRGGGIPCKEALPILAAQSSSSKDLYCSLSTNRVRDGFIEGCDKPDAIAALQRLIDGHVISTPALSTSTATATTRTATTQTATPRTATTRTTTTRTTYPIVPLIAKNNKIQDLGCTSQDESVATHALTTLLPELGVSGIIVRCLHDSQKQLYIRYSGEVKNLDAATFLSKEACRRGLPPTTCGDSSDQCWIKFSYSGDEQVLILAQNNGAASNDRIVANLNVLLGLETTTTTPPSTTTPAVTLPPPNLTDIQCDYRHLATRNCVNVETDDGSIVRASGGTRFLEKYFAIQHPEWDGGGTIYCLDIVNPGNLYDIVVDDLPLCQKMRDLMWHNSSMMECDEVKDEDDDSYWSFSYTDKSDCNDRVGISTRTLEQTTTTSTTKLLCAAGQAATSTGCDPCPDNTYQSSSNHQNPMCIEQQYCGPGQMIGGDSKTSKRTCSSCPDNKYQSSLKHRQTSCNEQPTCGAGTLFSADSKKAKRTCPNCDADTYQESTSHKSTSCAPQPKCDAGKKLINASATTLGVCVSPTTPSSTATTTITVNNKDGGSNNGAGQPEGTNDDSNDDNNNGDGGPPGATTTNERSNATNDTGARATDDSDNTTANGNSSSPPPEPQKSSSSTGTIVGLLVALILAVAVVGFILWRQKNGADSGGIPHISGNAAAAAPANSSQVGGVPSTYHNRMYNIDVNSNQEDANVDFGSDYATGPVGVVAANASTPSGTHASIVYSIPLEDGGGGGNAGGGSGDGDDAYGGVTYVAALNQNAPEYATAIEAGSTNALYAVVSLEGRRNAGGAGDGGTENHYDLPAPGERRRGPKKQKKKKEKQQQQQQQEDAPSMLYDVAQHAGGGSSASQSAEYSHLAPRGGGAVGGEQNNVYDLGPQQRSGGGGGGGTVGGERNNMYDLGPQQRGGGGAGGGDGAMYAELDSNA